MQNRKEQLQSVIDTARKEISEIDAVERRKSVEGLVGKHFKYRNRYSSDTLWWMYIRVTGITDSGAVETVTFQTDCYGKTEFDVDVNFSMPDAVYIPITKREFNSAFDKTLKKIQSMREN